MPEAPKKRSVILKVFCGAVVLLIVAAVVLPLVIDVNQFRPELQSRLAKKLGREVSLGNLKLALLSGGIEADDIVIADNPDFGSSPFLRARSLRAGVELKPLLLSKSLRINSFTIDAQQKLNFKMLARVKSATGITGGLVWIAGSKGLGFPFYVGGTTLEPSFSADFKGAAGDLMDAAKAKGAAAYDKTVRGEGRGAVDTKKR